MKYLLILSMILLSSPSMAARYTATFDSDETLCIAPITVKGNIPYYATINYKGTWDGATLTFYHSPNKTVPLHSHAVIIQNLTEADMVKTKNGTSSVKFGAYKPSSPEYICATMASSGTTSVFVDISDNQ